MVQRLTTISRKRKRLALVAVDMLLLPLALWLAFYLRLGEPWPHELADNWWILIAAPLVAIPVFIQQGLYRAVVRYMGAKAAFTIARAVVISTLLLLALIVFTHAQGLPRSSFFIYAGLALLLVGGSRMVLRAYIDVLLEGAERKELVAIYGAGRAGIQLAKALLAGDEYQPAFFVDDNKDIQRTELFGIKVFSPAQLPNLIEEFEVSQVLLAIPSLSHQRRKEILEQLESMPVMIRTLPGIEDIASGRVRVDDIREVEIEDLLGRDPVPPIEHLLHQCIDNKNVLVTGAGGSIGSELCRQIIQLNPKRLVLLERNEFNLYQIERELKANAESSIEIVPVLGSVNSKTLLTRVMQQNSIDTVYHAAAYKHVPLVEANPFEGIYNNVFGTKNAAEVAEECDVETFVLISTDKAVRPTNIMGASKRVAELVLQAMADRGSKTRFVMVRFGNVLGSSGSVVPLFKEQIKAGGPVTVTHPEVTRYFMTIPEAAQLVLQAGSMGKGGDVFVLDMGEPVKIADLARKMIHLSGFDYSEADSEDGIRIEYTGLRPGEKLYEELLIGNKVMQTGHQRIMRASESLISYEELVPVLAKLDLACVDNDVFSIQQMFQSIVSGYSRYDTVGESRKVQHG